MGVLFRFSIIFLIISCYTSPLLAEEHHQYLRTTGSERTLLGWSLSVEDSVRLTTNVDGQVDVTSIDTTYATSSWTVDDPETETHLVVERVADVLKFRGTFAGEPYDEQEEIDEAPWYQALSYTLRLYGQGARERREFWSIRPDTLDVHRMQVVFEGEEIISVLGEETVAIKLKIQATGFKKMFWSAHYWLRKSDGIFVRYEGPSGPPGSALTIVELDDQNSLP